MNELRPPDAAELERAEAVSPDPINPKIRTMEVIDTDFHLTPPWDTLRRHLKEPFRSRFVPLSAWQPRVQSGARQPEARHRAGYPRRGRDRRRCIVPYLANPGPHSYMILHVGAAEKAEINREHQDLLKEICAYRSYYCLDEKSSTQDGLSGISMPGHAH